jgi:nitrogenase molybdenum-iron protein beta chain
VSQSVKKVIDHAELFHTPEYQEMLARKATHEGMPTAQESCEVDDWTRTAEYREQNFKREALTINPAKACQPLGAVFAAAGFERTMSFVHGSQGCVAYYRSHLSRHFKEPASAVSSSMTEDAAVFGGLTNMVEGLANTYQLYSPKMIAVSTTCMAEVIGDDLNSFILQAKEKGSVPKDFDVPFAHTPAFVGSHVMGYDNMLKGILEHFWKDRQRAPDGKLNVIPGFDGFAVGNNRELKRILELMGIQYTLVSDVADQFDTPSDGEFRMYAGGTTLEQARGAIDAEATLSLQEYCTSKSLELAASKGQKTASLHYPLGVGGTDELILKLAELTGKAVPDQLTLERGRLVDAMADSQAYLHGKRYAIFGDPDFVYGMARFILETGGEPVHCLATNGNSAWRDQMQALFGSSEFGKDCHAWPGKDLWHLRSLMATEPVDLLVGNSYGKYLERDLKTPLVRLMFPIFDRHHHHRFPLWGYQGGLQVLRTLLDKIFDQADLKSNEPGKTDISFDLTR